ncbi:hypothetical protein OJ996_26220 [Luteolibacter sp. GHJ8]|uniref:DUF3592 domain-containing protein n=1 Tax=Luteolibacter rhizosphaerae TaxID=2989719 RepID=A0ABT3GB98_9BACT|nr:hypothetical protein [Luteolibacter rhizosphaerae]MCW1917110.1 hypothetical protein [Luteolibacter rhizosphaerae]
MPPPAPFIRSITFWAGLVVFFFLLNAWLDSRMQETSLVWQRTRGADYHAINREGLIWLFTDLHSPGRSGRTPEVLINRHDLYRGNPYPPADGFWEMVWFPPAVRHKAANGEAEIAVAHWFLILLHLALWGLLIYYRHRRIRRARATTASFAVADGG